MVRLVTGGTGFIGRHLLRHLATIERYLWAEIVQGKPNHYQGCGRDLADGYDQVLAFVERLHGELVAMQEWVRTSAARIVVIFEGRDAAGKGSTIRRITQAMDARFYRVIPIAAPGLVVAVKDLLDTAGIPTTYGAEPFRDRVPKEDAVVVQRLRATAMRVERLDQRLHLEARAAEDDRGGRVLRVEDPRQRRRLLRARHDVRDLADARRVAPRLPDRN